MAVSQALILAAGNGSRLRLPHQPLPKPLMPVGGMPLLRRVILNAREAGLRHFVIVVGYEAQVVQGYLSDHPIAGVTFAFVNNDEYKHKANGLSALKARNELREPFLLLMTDHIFQPATACRLLQEELGDGEVILAVDRKLDRIFDIDDATKVRLSGNRITTIGKALTDYDALDTGMFLCSPALFDALHVSLRQGNCSLSDGMMHLAARRRLRAFDIGEALWFDVDTPQSARDAEQFLQLNSGLRFEPQADHDGHINFTTMAGARAATPEERSLS